MQTEPLLGDVALQGLRQREAQDRGAALLAPLGHLAHAVHVPGDQVPAQRFGQRQRRLEVHRTAGTKAARAW